MSKRHRGGNETTLGTRRGAPLRIPRRRALRDARIHLVEGLEPRIVLNADITAAVSGANVTLNWVGDSTAADNLTITYDVDTLNYTFSDPGHTIDVAADPSIVITNNNSASVSIAPAVTYSILAMNLTDGTNAGTPVSGNTYTIGAESTGSIGDGAPVTIGPETGAVADTVNIGDATNAAGSMFASLVTLNYTGTATAALSIDDSSSASGATYELTSAQFSLGGTARVDYTNAALSGLTLNASAAGGNAVSVTNPPATANPVTVNMGSGTGNAVTLADPAHVPPTSRTVAVTTGSGGSTSLAINDTADTSSQGITVTSSQILFTGGQIFDYTGATLTGLALITSNQPGNNVLVQSTPATSNPIVLGMGTGTGNTISLGDATHAASALGDMTVTTGTNGSTGLTIDDSAATAGKAIAMDASSAGFSGGPTFTYSGATLSSLTLDASNAGNNTVNVTGTPATTSPVAIAMGGGTGNAVFLGDDIDAASALGLVDVTTDVTGSTSLAINDSADTTGQTITLDGTSAAFTGGPTFDYGGAALSSLALDASDAGSNTVSVNGTINGAGPLAIAMGAGTGNSLNFSNRASIQNGANITTGAGGSTGLTIDDSNGSSSQTIDVTADAIAFASGPTFNYSGATLTSLALNADNNGNNTVNVTGTPATTGPFSIEMFAGTGNSVYVGDASHAASEMGSINIGTGSSGGVEVSIVDSDSTAGQAVAMTPSSTKFGTGGPTFDYSNATLEGLSLFTSSAGGSAIDVTGPFGPTDPITISVGGGAAPNTLNIGSPTSAASTMAGNVTLEGSGDTALTIDDSANTAVVSYMLETHDFVFGASPIIDFGLLTGLTSLEIHGGSGGDTWRVDSSPASATTTINTGPAADQTDDVQLGNIAQPASALGPITVNGNATGTTTLLINDSANTSTTTPLLEYNSTTGTSDLSGLGASTISFNASNVPQVNLVASSTAATALTVDFSQGNPLPVGGSSFFQFGDTLGVDQNALVLQGELPGSTPFDQETYTPTNGTPGAGTIGLQIAGQTSTIEFGNLAPITDTVPAANYSFIAPSSAQAVNVTVGPIVGTFQTNEISSGDAPSAFEHVDFANKAHVLVDLSNIEDPTYVQPPATMATGTQSMTFNYFGADSSGHTLTVNGTTPGVDNTIIANGVDNTVNVLGVTAGGPLTIVNAHVGIGVPDNVNIGDNGDLSNINAGVTVLGGLESIDLNVDGSAATAPYNMLLESELSNGLGSLTGAAPGGPIEYQPMAIHSFGLKSGSGADVLTVDFVNGNPFLGTAAGSTAFALNYDGGTGGAAISFQDSSDPTTPDFSNETYAATGPGSGEVSFNQGAGGSAVLQGGVDFTNLTPTIDSVPVTNYTFAPSMAMLGGTVELGVSPLPGFGRIFDPSPSPSFERVDFQNKTNVKVDGSESYGLDFILNQPTAAVGQQTLAATLGAGSNRMEVEANPAGVPATLNGGGGMLATVAGTGLAAGTSPSNLLIEGGSGASTLRINSQGTTAALTPSTSTGPATVAFGTGTGFAFSGMSAIQEFATNNVPILATIVPPVVSARAGSAIVGAPVATFSGGTDEIVNTGLYQATINWGDGTAPTTGQIAAAPGMPGAYVVSGDHVYQNAGNYQITVTVWAQGGTFNSLLNNFGGVPVPVATQFGPAGSTTAPTARANVQSGDPDPPAVDFQGRLAPQSDSGVSDGDGITNVRTPTFVGTATPGAVVQVFATPAGTSAAPVLIAATTAGPAGNWAANVVQAPMADGSYAITAKASLNGVTANASLGTVVIDTQAPVITNIVLDRRDGVLEVFYQDNLSGMAAFGMINGANYHISAQSLNGKTPVPRKLVPTRIDLTPAATPNGVNEAIVQLNGGKRLPVGRYIVRIAASGIIDIAGNALDGRYYGHFPTGANQPGGNFAAAITATAHGNKSPFPIQAGFASPGTQGGHAPLSGRAKAKSRPRAIERPGLAHVARAHHAARGQGAIGALTSLHGHHRHHHPRAGN